MALFLMSCFFYDFYNIIIDVNKIMNLQVLSVISELKKTIY